MKTSWLLQWLAGLLLAIGFMGCTDYRLPTFRLGANEPREKVVTQELSGNRALVSLLRYDSQNRLQSITTYQSPDSSVAPVEVSVYEYDNQNRLVKLSHDVIRRANLGTTSQIYTYGYSEAGQESEITYTKKDSRGGLWSVGLRYDTAPEMTVAERAELEGGGYSAFRFMGDNLALVSEMGQASGKSTPYANSMGSAPTSPFSGTFVIPAHFKFADVSGPILIFYRYIHSEKADLFNTSYNTMFSAIGG